jgi:uncharacterized membrane protein
MPKYRPKSFVPCEYFGGNGLLPSSIFGSMLWARALTPWLMFLDFTVVSMALNFGRPFFFVQVLYPTGLSVIAMAALVWIGPRLVLVVGGANVLLAPVAILPLLHAPGALALLRTFTVLPGPLPGGMGIVLYPFVPWLGMMCLGFGYGHVFRLPASVRARTIAWTGAGSLVIFAVVRG